MNAAKLERMFSKPFVDALGGHMDAVEVLARPRGGEGEDALRAMTWVASGGWEGGTFLRTFFSFRVFIYCRCCGA